MELQEAAAKIKQLAAAQTKKAHLTEKREALDWPQDVIRKYYTYCLERQVMPTLDLQNATLDLYGPKDAVRTNAVSLNDDSRSFTTVSV